MMEIREIATSLEGWLKIHSLSVARVSRHIARMHGIHEWRAYRAGFLHDIAKELPENNLIDIVSQERLSVDRLEREIPGLWHAQVGAYLARKHYGIQDEEILEAIRWHSLGHPDMGPLAQIIFVADYCDPERGFEQAKSILELSTEGLLEAVLRVFAEKLTYLVSTNRIIHPLAIEGYNRFLDIMGMEDRN